MPTHLYIERLSNVTEDEERRFELLLATTQCAGFPEGLTSLRFPVSELPIGDDYRLTVLNILGKLPDDAVSFWAIEKPGAPGQEEKIFMHRHWLVGERHMMRFKPEPVSQKSHAHLLVEIAEVLDATHIGIFTGRPTATLFRPDERIVWPRPDGTWDVCSLDGEVLETVPAAA